MKLQPIEAEESAARYLGTTTLNVSVISWPSRRIESNEYAARCWHIEGYMDTFEQVAIETSSHTKRRRRTVEEKRRFVEETLEAGASVARRHVVNAN